MDDPAARSIAAAANATSGFRRCALPLAIAPYNDSAKKAQNSGAGPNFGTNLAT